MNPNNCIEGRWLTPDLLGGDITNPQSLNRYAYALNNPTTLTDPLGLDPSGCTSQIDENGNPYVSCSGPDTVTVNGGEPPSLGLIMCELGFGGCGQTTITGPVTGYGQSGGGGGGGGAPAPKPAPPATGPVVPSNPCSAQGRALAPSDYAKTGKNDPWYSLNFDLDVKYGWGTGQYLDAQPLTSVPATWTAAAYGNYVYGVYMKAAQVPLWVALRGAEYYALKKTYPVGTPMQPWYPGLPAANAQNITNGYNAQANGTACQAATPLPPPPGS